MRRAAVGVAVPILMAVIGAAPATATTAACGTISHRVTLTADLTCSVLHVTARVDLAGHTISAADFTAEGATFTNGTVRCDGGTITVTGSRFVRAGVVGYQCPMTITGNRMRGPIAVPVYNDSGVAEVLAVDLPVVIDGNDIAGYTYGISAIGVTSLDGRDLTDLTVTGNRLHHGTFGAQIRCAGECVVDGNTIDHTLRGILGGTEGDGVITITGNRFRFNTYQPFALEGTVVSSGNLSYRNGLPCIPVAC